jgi:Fe-S-cluster containining protein
MKYGTFREAYDAVLSGKDDTLETPSLRPRYLKACYSLGINAEEAQNTVLVSSLELLKKLCISEIHDSSKESYYPIKILTDMLTRLGKEHLFRAAEQDQMTVSCKNNCWWCCTQPVDVTSEEARSVHKHYLEKHGEFSAEQKNRLFLQKNFNSLNREGRKCVYLVNKQCSVHDNKPSNCAIYSSVSPVSICKEISLSDRPELVIKKILFLDVLLCFESTNNLISLLKGTRDIYHQMHKVLLELSTQSSAVIGDTV